MTNSIVFGIHAVSALLEERPDSAVNLFIQKGKEDTSLKIILASAKKNGIVAELVEKNFLDKLSNDGNHQGVIIKRSAPKIHRENELSSFIDLIKGTACFLILDCVQDPHNLGACLRSADAFGVHAVIIPKDKSANVTPIVAKVASGALESIPIFEVTNLVRAIEILKEKGIWVYGAAEEAKRSLFAIDLKGPIAIVLGSEGNGLRRLTKDSCDELIAIPMQGVVTSLNVSVTAGIFLFEIAKQRNV